MSSGYYSPLAGKPVPLVRYSSAQAAYGVGIIEIRLELLNGMHVTMLITDADESRINLPLEACGNDEPEPFQTGTSAEHLG